MSTARQVLLSGLRWYFVTDRLTIPCQAARFPAVFSPTRLTRLSTAINLLSIGDIFLTPTFQVALTVSLLFFDLRPLYPRYYAIQC